MEASHYEARSCCTFSCTAQWRKRAKARNHAINPFLSHYYGNLVSRERTRQNNYNFCYAKLARLSGDTFNGEKGKRKRTAGKKEKKSISLLWWWWQQLFGVGDHPLVILLELQKLLSSKLRAFICWWITSKFSSKRKAWFLNYFLSPPLTATTTTATTSSPSSATLTNADTSPVSNAFVRRLSKPLDRSFFTESSISKPCWFNWSYPAP